VVLAFQLGIAPCAIAQQLEPRAYTNLPVGLNFLLAGYAHSQGDVLLDPSLPITNAGAKVDILILGYLRSLDLWGKSGSVGLVLPRAWISARGDLEGQPSSATRSGMADPELRLSINFLGAPALSAEEFREYRQDTIVGTSLVVTAPWGQYDGTKLVNIGTNRWTFRPQIGVSQALGQWVLEGNFGVSCGRRSMRPTTQAAARRWTVCSTPICSKTRAGVRRLENRWTGATRSSSTSVPARARETGPTSRRADWPGSMPGAPGSEVALNLAHRLD
jgi:hypothetical protein